MRQSTVGTEQASVILEGFIDAVTEEVVGFTLATDAALGATSVVAMEPWGLPDTGSLHVDALDDGTLGEDLDYSAVDVDTGVVTFAAGFTLAAAQAAGTWFEYRPYKTYRYAWVRLGPDDPDVVVARIPAYLEQNLATQQYDPGLECQIQRIGDDWVVTDLPGVESTIGASETLVTGRLLVIDPVTGDTVGDISPDGAQFEYLAADVVESPGIPQRNTDSRTLYVDGVNGNDDNDGQALTPMSDTFTRTVAPTSWGTSDSGHLWSIIQNTGNLVDVNGTDGRIRLNGPSQQIVLRNAFGASDGEMLAKFMFNVRPAAGTIFAGIAARVVDNQACVGAMLGVTAAGSVSLNITDRVAGTWADVATLSALYSYASDAALAAVNFMLRLQWQGNSEIGGTDIRAKVWRDGIDTEPDDWQLVYNETAGGGLQSAYGCGVMMRSGGSVTAVNHLVQYRDLSAYCLDPSGLVIDPTFIEGVGALQSVTAALEKVGQINEGSMRIILAGEIFENVEIRGLYGGGSLVIDGAGTAILDGFLKFRNVRHDVIVRSFTIQDTGDAGAAATVDLFDSSYVQMTEMGIQTNSARANNVSANNGSVLRIDNSQLNGSTNRCLYSANGSIVYAAENKGTGAGTSYQATCGIIFQSGTKPTDATATSLGGQIFGSTSSNSGGTPPPTSTKKTKTVTCNATKSWRGVYDPPWRDGDEPIQGSYAGGANSRGFFFYGTKCFVGAGKVCDSLKVYFKRPSSGGASSAQAIYVWLHNYKSQSDAGTSGALQEGPYKVGSLAWGTSKTFVLPKNWGDKLLDGSRRGIAIAVGDGSPYVILAGRNGNEGEGKLTIVYH